MTFDKGYLGSKAHALLMGRMKKRSGLAARLREQARQLGQQERRGVQVASYSEIAPDAEESVLAWGTEVTRNITQNRNTASTFTAQILPLHVRQPMRVIELKWDLRTNATYFLRWLYEANAASYHEELDSKTVGGGTGLFGYVPDPPLILMPGTHYFCMYTSPAVLWYDYNSAIYRAADGAFTIGGLYYNTTHYDYIPPIQLTYSVGEWV